MGSPIPTRLLYTKLHIALLFWLVGLTTTITTVAVLIFWGGTHHLPSLTVAESLAKDAFALAAGAGAAVGLVVTYRRQQSIEDEALTQRYLSAAELMGHDKAVSRLAGVTAMARLADDWDDQRQMCVDVLCAYLRMPFDPKLLDERQVRKTILGLIVDHTQVKDGLESRWSRLDFDFSGSELNRADFYGARFSGRVFFLSTKFFDRADFTEVTYSGGANFYESAFYGEANFVSTMFFDRVFFLSTKFSKPADFSGATFSGSVDFSEATFFDRAGSSVSWKKGLKGVIIPPPVNFYGLP